MLCCMCALVDGRSGDLRAPSEVMKRQLAAQRFIHKFCIGPKQDSENQGMQQCFVNCSAHARHDSRCQIVRDWSLSRTVQMLAPSSRHH